MRAETADEKLEKNATSAKLKANKIQNMKTKKLFNILLIATASLLAAACGKKQSPAADGTSDAIALPDNVSALLFFSANSPALPLSGIDGFPELIDAIKNNPKISNTIKSYAEKLSAATNGASEFFAPKANPLEFALKLATLKKVELAVYTTDDISLNASETPQIHLIAKIPDAEIMATIKTAFAKRAKVEKIGDREIFKIKVGKGETESQICATFIKDTIFAADTPAEVIKAVEETDAPKNALKNLPKFQKACPNPAKTASVLYVDFDRVKCADNDVGKFLRDLDTFGCVSNSVSMTEAKCTALLNFKSGKLQNADVKFPPLKYSSGAKITALPRTKMYMAISCPEFSGELAKQINQNQFAVIAQRILASSEIEYSMAAGDSPDFAFVLNAPDIQARMDSPEIAPWIQMANATPAGGTLVEKISDTAAAVTVSKSGRQMQLAKQLTSETSKQPAMLANLHSPQNTIAKFYIDSKELNNMQIAALETMRTDALYNDQMKASYEILKLYAEFLESAQTSGYIAIEGDTLRLESSSTCKFNFKKLAEKLKDVK